MSDLILKSLEINNFRSIRGRIHAPLDANVVLVHGENGAGKTSLLSALELALTGKIQSLERADPNYEKQLLHYQAEDGYVQLQVQAEELEQNFRSVLNENGMQSITALDELRANFFSGTCVSAAIFAWPTTTDLSGCQQRRCIAISKLCKRITGTRSS